MLSNASNANLVFVYLAPMVLLPALALHFGVDHKRGKKAVGRTAADGPKITGELSSPLESGADDGI